MLGQVSPAGTEPPFALDGTVGVDKVRELLAVGTELTWLDYKAECDLGKGAAGLVAIAKDVGAMHIQGGYLVVGADNSGQPVGITPAQAGLFDDAALRQKLEKYVGSAWQIRSAVHDLGDGTTPRLLALVWVAPHPDGWCVFACDGQYTDRKGENRTEFSKGDTYARHGSRSEPWNQADIAEARARLVAREKDFWRAERAQELHLALQALRSQAAVADGPAAAFTWQLDAAGFEAATVELMRRQDEIPVRRMLRVAQAEAADLLRVDRPDAAEELVTLLDRLTTVAALALDLARSTYFGLVLDALLGLYDLGITRQDATSGRSSAWLWLRLAKRLYCPRRPRGAARRLDQRPPGRGGPAAEPEPGSTRRSDVAPPCRDEGIVGWPVAGEHHQRAASALPAVVHASSRSSEPRVATRPARPVDPEPTGQDPLLTSACQFDFLATVISGIGATNQHELLDVSYPPYARYYGNRVRPLGPRW